MKRQMGFKCIQNSEQKLIKSNEITSFYISSLIIDKKTLIVYVLMEQILLFHMLMKDIK